ncbi:MAG: DUF3253 domain-containing protein [Akkermansiaceae bacterium]
MKEKSCSTCGRVIEWRKKWSDCWAEVRYCSDSCRSNKPGKLDHALESAILKLLSQGASGATICPSEAARAVFSGDRWRDEMERTRQAARRLVAQGKINILQKGRIIDPSTAKGPIRLGKPNR